jgi:hypothetical protein
MIKPIIDGMDKADSERNSARNAPGIEYKRAQDGHGLGEILQQQDQHHVDAKYAGQHGQGEASAQFIHRFGVTARRLHHPGGSLCRLGSASTAASTTPSARPFSSISKLMLRMRS